ncbi:DUF3224 domain-containing protein [Tessaracoccus sp. Z1128]
MVVNATFEIEIAPEEGLLPGTRRFEFAKVWSGEAEGASRGFMLSAGNPAEGTAGYVALEVFEGRIGGRSGTVAFQQFGTMRDGTQEVRYEVVPGSGTEDLAGCVGSLTLEIDAEGVHHVAFDIA